MSDTTATAAVTDASVELWACDGCTFTGTAIECDAHVDAQVTNADGSVKAWADVTCHGSYAVGGPAWEAHVFEGVHPMSTVMVHVQAALATIAPN